MHHLVALTAIFLERERERVTAVWLHHYPSPSVRQFTNSRLEQTQTLLKSYILRK
jgi:hypothetical protein